MVQHRLADGSAEGWFAVYDSTTMDRRKPIARPLDWDDHEREERVYQQAEEDRLMYVASTRAKEELIIARCDKMEEKSVWKCFHPLLDTELASELVLDERRPELRPELEAEPEQFQRAIAELRAARDALKRPAYHAESITTRLRPDDVTVRKGRRRSLRALQLQLGLEAPPNAEPFGHDREGNPIFQLGLTFDGAQSIARETTPLSLLGPMIDQNGPGGPEWGNAAHVTLQAAARGLADEALRVVARNALLFANCPVDAHGEPIWLGELIALVQAMRASELWQRAHAARRVLYEIPFELQVTPEEWTRLSGASNAALPELLIGRIDLAFEEPDGWVIADYKTDVAEPKVLKARTEHYRRQVDVYAACWTRITGARVKERRLVFTAPGAEDVVW
jgi:ATP-dependent helicase/nuclease subunit A